MSVHHTHAVILEARSGYQIPWSWNFQWLWATMWALGIKPSPLEKQSVLLSHFSSSLFLLLQMVFCSVLSRIALQLWPSCLSPPHMAGWQVWIRTIWCLSPMLHLCCVVGLPVILGGSRHGPPALLLTFAALTRMLIIANVYRLRILSWVLCQ